LFLHRYIDLKEYGNAPDISMHPGKVSQAVPIIRRLNRHAELVVKSLDQRFVVDVV
jgi:hypothetical protein